MWMSREFRTDLAEKTDGQLYEVLAHAEDYLPEALEAARTEVHRRHLAPERGAQLQALARATVAEEAQRAEAPLGWIFRILFLLAPFLAVFCAASYLSRGYHAREDQCWRWVGYGVLGRVLLGVGKALFA
jgi:hypothetical protein